ncbi:hypothetical protein M2390_002408 [Mycetocola sp. BIGb0189]|uniref:hypothetical protein n=1 Tax=Mycetocola sp. BIGb0189 TaxID=2940604 RepID=UPI002167C711|nr:hypothetical protein [Mycetocola sp. BIGb0189]MCS4277204.1 hypothetical protein [Mycetocola sp. BIGb0189]
MNTERAADVANTTDAANTADAAAMLATDASFVTPDVWHSPATYWFWHHLPDEDQVRTQVRQMHAAGIKSFQVQARLSFPMHEYLEPAYLTACRWAVEEAAALGMIVGFYDDYNWQTGQAGGRAVAGHDHLRERHLFWTRIELSDGTGTGEISGIVSGTEGLGPAAMAWHYDGSVPLWTDWRIERALAVDGTETTARATSASVVDITAATRIEATDTEAALSIAGANPALGSALVLVSARSSTSHLVNPLDPEAVDRFIEAGYEPFREAVGDHFGSTVRYVFFDQPHAVYYDWAQRSGGVGSSVPIHTTTLDLARAIGEDTHAATIWAVFTETEDPAALALRARFWQFYAELSMEGFLGKLRDWSHRYGLLQSGHEVLTHIGTFTPGTEFGDWDLRANFGLDHFGVDAYRDLTAVDAQDGVAQLSPRLGDSIARATGRTGTIVEQYFLTPPEGGTPWSGHWGLTLDELRSTTIRHHLAGMRQMVFHGFYQTHGHGNDHESMANPRFDFPPGINFEPWFADFHAAFAAESARLSEFLEPLSDEASVLLFWPLRTIWTHGQSGAHFDQFGAWAKALDTAGIPWRVVDERALADIAAGSIPTAQILVLPGVRTLANEASVASLEAIEGTGIRVFRSGDDLTTLQDGAAARALPGTHLSTAPEASALAAVLGVAPSGATVFRVEMHGAGDDGINDGTAGSADNAGLRIRAGVDARGFTRVALFNDGVSSVSGVLTGTVVAEWDASGGQARSLTDHRVALEPGELRLFVWAGSAAHESQTPSTGSRSASNVDAQANPGTPAPADTRILSNDWSLTTAHGGSSVPIDVTAGWQTVLPEYSGAATYRTTFELAEVSGAILELPAVSGSARLLINGTLVGERGWRPYRFAIPAELLRVGTNEVAITVFGSAANEFYAGTGLRPEPELTGLLATPTLFLTPPTEGSHHA